MSADVEQWVGLAVAAALVLYLIATLGLPDRF